MNNYLFALQTARETWASFLTPILFGISEFAFYGIIVVIFLLYICVDKKKYITLLFAYVTGNFLMNIAKLTACIYRPWLTDTRLHPSDLVKKSATGYSFPSGHVTGAAAFYGGLAYNEKQGKNRKWIELVLFILILLTAFSRNWLGAHTFKDVFAAILLGIVSIVITEFLHKYLIQNPDKDIPVTILTCVFSIAMIIIFSLKSYPMDYAADGSLICDPVKMQMDFWQSAGMFMGISICLLIDKRYIHFTTDISLKRKIIRGVIASVLFVVTYLFALKKLEHLIDPLIGSFIRAFGTMIICLGIFPAIFTGWEKKHPEN